MQPEGEGVMWKATDYGDAGYWDARYKTEKVGAPFDWYRSYAALRDFIRRFIPTSSRVLMLGCGNSLVSEKMAMDGYTEIVNVDISSVVIDMMKQRHKHISQLTSSYRVEDEINGSSGSAELNMEPVPLTENGQLPAGFILEDLESHYIYVCEKMHELN